MKNICVQKRSRKAHSLLLSCALDIWILLTLPLPECSVMEQDIEKYPYRISSNKRPRHLFNFEALRCSAYWRVALKGGRYLFQSQRNYSHKISKLDNSLSKWQLITTIIIYSLIYSRITSDFLFFVGLILNPLAF